VQKSKLTTPFGSWPSKITAELITRAAPSLNWVQSHGDRLFWVENRPWEAGRSVIMCKQADGQIIDLFSSPFSHSSKVHEYGGAAYTIAKDLLYFVNAADQRIYQLDLIGNKTPKAFTPEGPWRFADLIIDEINDTLIAVCEHHRENQEPENYIASIKFNLENVVIERLVFGADFYAYPRLSPDNQQFCWIQWDHPQMPWDATQLWRAQYRDDSLSNHQLIAGEDNNQAIFQPQWSPDNQLYFVSDENNWWNIYRFNLGHSESIFTSETEFATPLWQLGMSTYCFLNDHLIGCSWTSDGIWQTGVINTKTHTLNPIASEYTSLHGVCSHGGNVCMVAGAAAIPEEIISITPPSSPTVVYSPASLPIDTEELSQPESIFFPSAGGQTVHAFYYPPTNTLHSAVNSDLPPAIAICHGGPTGATDSGLNLKIQYWTNRGFAVVDINYRGSTGFGRTYRQELVNAWGLADVEDTQYAMTYLASKEKIDLDRCIIRGGSAGGYTVLSALTFTDTFKAGASLYGIGDLETLATDTHKFESRYLDSLIGPYPAQKDVYKARSPIHHAEGLNCPVIFLQGLEDKVVPPNQAEMMVNILQQKGIKVAHVTFDDEGHGFRKANNIIHAMESELNFYRQVFDLEEIQ